MNQKPAPVVAEFDEFIMKQTPKPIKRISESKYWPAGWQYKAFRLQVTKKGVWRLHWEGKGFPNPWDREGQGIESFKRMCRLNLGIGV